MGKTYVVADIHGMAERFHALLQQVPILEEDTLYILGDVIDRGPDGVELLREIRTHRNWVLLMGNHEKMCVQTLGPGNVYGAKALWLGNGGTSTYTDLNFLCSAQEKAELIAYMAALPEQLRIAVGGRDYLLVHAAPGSTSDVRLWARPDSIDWENALPHGVTAIIGHTPTQFLSGRKEKPMRIWHDSRYLCIDCGCGMMSPNGRLACLCLDTGEEFYVS